MDGVSLIARILRFFGRVPGLLESLGRTLWTLVSRWFWRRWSLRSSCIHDLQALNSPLIIHGPGLHHIPEPVSLQECVGVEHTRTVSGLVQHKRRQHSLFVATWARAAKARFHFAMECVDTAVNRAALHRWFLSQWKELEVDGRKMPLHHIDLYMGDAIELALQPTFEHHICVSKRAHRRWARMEVYNEAKFKSMAR